MLKKTIAQALNVSQRKTFEVEYLFVHDDLTHNSIQFSLFKAPIHNLPSQDTLQQKGF